MAESYPQLGEPAPAWTLADWMNSKPISLQDLAGKVVLVRWWTAPYCPYCSASAPALNRWQQAYADRGFTVIGVYHHKVSEALDLEEVRGYAQRLDFHFPVAVDHDWATLSEWWLNRGGRKEWTSVSFLLDRRGVVRHIHPGGQYIDGDEAHAQMQAWITRLIAEPGGDADDSPSRTGGKP